MNFSLFKQLALLITLLTLVGCASAPKLPAPVDQPSLELATLVGNASTGDTIQLPANNSLGMDTVVVDRTYYAASGLECRRLRDASGVPIRRVACKNADGQWRFARDLNRVSSIQKNKLYAASTAQTMSAEPLIPSAATTLLLNSDGSVSNTAMASEEVNTDSVVVTNDFNNANYSEIVSSVEDNGEQFAVELMVNDSSDIVQRELYANETLWSFAKRTTGNALNWKSIAELNNITDAKTLAPGAQLNIPVALVSEGG